MTARQTDTLNQSTLVQRLRTKYCCTTENCNCDEAADTIEALCEALQKIADAPAWGYPDKWENTPAEVRQLARAAIAKATA